MDSGSDSDDEFLRVAARVSESVDDADYNAQQGAAAVEQPPSWHDRTAAYDRTGKYAATRKAHREKPRPKSGASAPPTRRSGRAAAAPQRMDLLRPGHRRFSYRT